MKKSTLATRATQSSTHNNNMQACNKQQSPRDKFRILNAYTTWLLISKRIHQRNSHKNIIAPLRSTRCASYSIFSPAKSSFFKAIYPFRETFYCHVYAFTRRRCDGTQDGNAGVIKEIKTFPKRSEKKETASNVAILWRALLAAMYRRRHTHKHYDIQGC